jgi:porin
MALAAALGVTALCRPTSVGAQTTAGAGDFWEQDTLSGDWGGLRSRLEKAGLTIGLQEQSELWGNVTGGLSRGGAYDGLFTLSVAVDLDKAIHWPNASLQASALQIHGFGPTALRVGSLQTISGIEATASTKLFDFWFEQKLLDGKLSLRFGQEGADEELMLTDHGALFLNSAFGFPPLTAIDLPSGGPSYPLAAPFVRIQYQPSGELTVIGAVYTADPAPPGTGDPQLRDRHGTAFRLDDHALGFAELQYAPEVLKRYGQPGTYKLGAWYASGPFADPLHDAEGLSLANPASIGVPRLHSGDHGIYAVIDQMVWKRPNTEAQGLGLFLRLMQAPADRNLTDFYVGGGLTWKGPIPERQKDEAGIAVTHIGIGGPAVHFSNDEVFFAGFGTRPSPGETIVEATYNAQLAPWLKIQPDLQYVVNPGAGIVSTDSPAPLKNDLIFGVRVTVNF